MKFSLTSPDWSKVFKDNYHKYSVPTEAGADDTTTIKFQYLNEEASKPHSTGTNTLRSDQIEEFRCSSQVYKHKHSYLWCWMQEVTASPSQSPRQSSS
jgi:hypothetical protein